MDCALLEIQSPLSLFFREVWKVFDIFGVLFDDFLSTEGPEYTFNEFLIEYNISSHYSQKGQNVLVHH